MSDLVQSIVKIIPVEYRIRAKYPNITIYQNIKIKKDLNMKELEEKLNKIKMKGKPRTLMNPGHYLIYQYDDKPLIIVDLDTTEFLTTKYVIDYYGKMRVQQQASILLRLLKKMGYASYKRRILSTYRLGKNVEDVKNVMNEYIDFLKVI